MRARRAQFRLTAALAVMALLALAPLARRASSGEPRRQTPSSVSQPSIAPEKAPSSLVAKMLEAGGCDDAELERADDTFRAFAERLRAEGSVRGDVRHQAEAIHQFVHREILRGKYDVAGSDLAAVLSGGPFNCVTASGLFLALARQFDVEARPVAVVGHVWCRVSTHDGSFDVETTCRDWFALAGGLAAGKAPPENSVVAQHLHRAARARVLDEPAWIAVFHYNRGVRLLKEQRFHAAATANLRALRLDPQCEPARENLLVTLNDWSLALSAHGLDALALDLLHQAMVLDGDYQPFLVNYRFISQRQNPAPAAARSENPISKEHPDPDISADSCISHATL